MPYTYPVGDVYVSDDWQGHKDRNPPSQEPGTDFACKYGTVLKAAGAGVVTDRKVTTTGAMGRFVRITLDDGRTTRSIHMAEVRVALGQRVSQGQQLGLSGASANGSDWGVGVHTHQTLWPRGAFQDPTIDFELYVGSPTPIPVPIPVPEPPDDEEDEMALRMIHWTGGSVIGSDATSKVRRAIWSEIDGYFMEWSESGSTYANAMAGAWNTGASVALTQSLAAAVYQACQKSQPKAGGSGGTASRVEVTNFDDMPSQKITLAGTAEPQG